MKGLGGAGLAWLTLLIAPLLPSLQGQVSEAFLETHRERLEPLFSELDVSNADIAEVRSLWEAGNRAEAAESLCAYYQSKPFSLEVLDAPLIPGNFLEQAEAAIDGRFFLLNEWEPAGRTPSGSIDWEGRGSGNDKERAWMLNRHPFLLSLAEAGEQTDDPRFAKTLNELLAGWIVANPYPNRLTFSAQWRALEVARRILNSWVYVFYGYNTLEDETRLLVLSSVLDHADALLEHTSFWGGNHLITEKMALLAIAAAWPEFESSGDWREDAVKVISSEFLSQTYPDGSYKELSNHYQRVVLTNTTKFLKLLEAVDPEAQNSAVVQRIEKMWDFFAGVMRPDGFGPLNNAADQEHNAAYVKEVWERFDRPDWLYMASNGTEGPAPSGPERDDTEGPALSGPKQDDTEGPALSGPLMDDTEVVPPPGTSRLFEWAGQAILRTGWERDAAWVYFDAGPYGTAHQHVDRLHVSVALDGRPLLVDNGRYIYQPGPWKDYFQGPASHNVLLLDGQPAEQAPREIMQPLEMVFEETEASAFAAASSRFVPKNTFDGLPILASSTPWTRAVLLDKQGRFVLILDHLVSFRRQEWKALWHFHPDVSVEEARAALTLVSQVESPQPSLQAGSTKPLIAGFHSPEYNVKQPAVQMEYSGSLDKPTTLVWLLRGPKDDGIEIEILSPQAEPVQQFLISEEGNKIAEITIQIYPEPKLISYKFN